MTTKASPELLALLDAKIQRAKDGLGFPMESLVRLNPARSDDDLVWTEFRRIWNARVAEDEQELIAEDWSDTDG